MCEQPLWFERSTSEREWAWVHSGLAPGSIYLIYCCIIAAAACLGTDCVDFFLLDAIIVTSPI